MKRILFLTSLIIVALNLKAQNTFPLIGNVGIGTTSPTHKLHVVNNGFKARFSGTDGYIDIGPANSSWAHIYTDRPAFIFNKDIYTIGGGFNSYSNSDLLLKTNGTTRLTINNSTGNIGIGTASPARKLDVNGDINFSGNLYQNGQLISLSSGIPSEFEIISRDSPLLRLESTGNGEDCIANIELKGYSQGGEIGQINFFHTDTDSPLASIAVNTDDRGPGFSDFFIKTADDRVGELSTKLSIDNDGKVGIGTISPTQKLDVAGSINFSGYFFKNGKKVNLDNIVWNKFNNDISYTAGKVGVGTSTPGAKLEVKGGDILLKASHDLPGKLVFRDSDDGSCGMIWTRHEGTNKGLFISSGDYPADFSINSAGNVGIGTTSPSQKLHVSGDTYLQGKVYIGNTDTYLYRDAANRIKTDDTFYVGTASPYTYLYSANTYLGASSGDKIHLRENVFDWTSGGGGIINASGNVGIGTTNPNYKLDVNGTIRANEIKVNLDGADFVFEEDYNLRSLKEVEAFIKENKHLPEIESAEEMQNSDNDLGELNMKLLQKIEELTLYTIQQQRLIELQGKRLQELEALIEKKD